MNRNAVSTTISVALTAACAATAAAQTVPDRTTLPIHEPQYPHSTTLDVRKATPPPRFEVKAPAGAPNVLIVLIDDMGFGQSSPFGGPINMPTVGRLATNGLRYNQFHTTALSSPTRMALLTGRNHHMCNTGRHGCRCGRGGNHYNLTIGDLCVFLRSKGFDGGYWFAGYEDHQDQ